MSRPPDPLDLAGVRTHPLASRKSQVTRADFGRPLPAGAKVRASKVRASSAPAISIMTTMRSPAAAIATTRAPEGKVAVTSAAATLPSARKTR